MRRVGGERLLGILRVGWALLFAGTQYSSDMLIPLSARGACNMPFSPELFSRFFCAGMMKGKFHIFNVIVY